MEKLYGFSIGKYNNGLVKEFILNNHYYSAE